jgi:hypothetical protein
MRSTLYVVAGLALAPVALRADTVPAPASASENPAMITYAAPILALSLVGLAGPWVMRSGGGSLGVLGVGLYLFGPPLIHLSHDNPGRAAGSLALRVALPLAGLVVGAGVDRGLARKTPRSQACSGLSWDSTPEGSRRA